MTEYVNDKRMNAATELIRTTKDSIQYISQTVGIGDKKQFYKLFREHTGTTPDSYRKSLKD